MAQVSIVEQIQSLASELPYAMGVGPPPHQKKINMTFTVYFKVEHLPIFLITWVHLCTVSEMEALRVHATSAYTSSCTSAGGRACRLSSPHT